jgi:glyoxylase-like metal-dependent hydrolase (beta-lactamase superfamily II)
MRIFLAACGVLAWSQAHAQAPVAPPPPVSMPISVIKPNLYMITGDGGNAEVLITDKGVLLVDTKLPGERDYNELLRVIGTVTKQPIKVVIITHHHVDHAGNIDRFIASGAQVIGQRNMPERMAAYFVPRRMSARLTPPTTLYDKTYDVKLGEEQAKLYNFGPAHTGDDTIVLFPKLKTVVFGDLVVADPLPPLFDGGPGGGSLRGLANTLGEALKLDWDAAVPGHGERPLTRADSTYWSSGFRLLSMPARPRIRSCSRSRPTIWDGSSRARSGRRRNGSTSSSPSFPRSRSGSKGRA